MAAVKKTKRGVMRPYRGKNTPERNELARRIREARNFDSASVKGEKHEFSKSGRPYEEQKAWRFRGDSARARSIFKSGILGESIITKTREVIEKKGKARIFDIGSAKGEYWTYFLNKFTPEERANIEIHTPNPSVSYRDFLVALSPAENHHIGVLETYDPSKLGRFDIVTGFFSLAEKTGSDSYDVFRKIKRLLRPHGTFYSYIGHGGLDNIPAPEGVKKLLGKNFSLDLFDWKKGTFTHAVVFTREK